MIYEPLKKGELIPTVEITNIHSQTLNINDLLYDGLNFLLFFSIGCSSCAEALNDLFLNKHIFNDKNIKVILISLNEKNVTDKFFEENGLLSEEVFYVNKPKKAMSDLHITGTPYYILSQQTVIQKAHIVMNNHWKKMLNDIE
jgi:peroxiredoxin